MDISIRRHSPVTAAYKLFALCMLAAATVAGCGGGGGTDTASQVTSAAVAPQISAQPQNVTVNSGETATFSVTATGTAPLSYQWMKDSTAISSSSATSASYTTPATTSSDNGASFTVMVTNSAGTITSSAATLTVNSSSNPPAATPTFSVPAGTYSSAQSVKLACSTASSTIYYTTDGTTPTHSSKVYSAVISVSSTETLEAICTASGYTDSAVASAAYTISGTTPVAATPTFSVPAGTYSSAQSVKLACSTASSTIYYTTNGSTPTHSSSAYSAAISVASTETIKAVCSASGYTDSAVASATYTINTSPPGAATPTFSVPGGVYTSAQSVSLSCSTASSTIYYTTNGTTPTTSSSAYSSAISVSSTETIEAICTASGYTNSAVASATYTISASGVGYIPTANNVATNWQNAGLQSVGGIPNRTTVCATVTPSGGDDYSNIQAAINGCAANGVVQISGALTVKLADLPINISKGIVLRGVGSCGGNASNYPAPVCASSITVSDGLLAYDGGNCGTSSPGSACPNAGEVILMAPGRPDYNWSWAQCGNNGSNIGTGCGAVPLDADAAQGATTVQVHTTSGFSVGMWVLIDEASGAQYFTDPISADTGYGQVWAASDWLSTSNSPATAKVLWPKSTGAGGWDLGSAYPYQSGSVGCWFSYCDRVTGEIHLITAVGAGPCPGTNCTLTFDDPVTIAFRQGGGTSFTGTIASGSKTLTVVSGSVVVGQIVAGAGIPQGDYIASGSGSTYTMSLAATASATAEAMTIGSHEAQVYPGFYNNQSGTGTPGFVQYAGVENLSVMRGPSGSITMVGCAYCWIKGVEVGEWYGGGIAIEDSVRSQVDTVYVHHCWNSTASGGEYPFMLDQASTEILITNSIGLFGGKGMVARAGGAGSVVSYNYIDDTMYDDYSGIGDYWVEQGLSASHFSGPHHVLFEGNWGPNLDDDNTHGNSTYITYFRNQGSGLRTPFTDPSANKAVNDFTGVGWACGGGTCSAQGPGPLRAAGPTAYNYWYAFVGNVLGTAGQTTAANGWSYSGDWNGNRMFMLGWTGSANGQDPYLDGANASYIWIDGNYDYVNGAVTWSSLDLAHVLPNSLYLATAPAFFTAGASCTYPWPWVTPTSSPYVQPNSCAGSGLPALARWKAGTPFAQP